jgi:predicted ester cyclase
MGIPPTGKKVTVSGTSIWKIVGSKNVEEWEIFDTMSLMQQLGAIPAPGEGGE